MITHLYCHQKYHPNKHNLPFSSPNLLLKMPSQYQPNTPHSFSRSNSISNVCSLLPPENRIVVISSDLPSFCTPPSPPTQLSTNTGWHLSGSLSHRGNWPSRPFFTNVSIMAVHLLFLFAQFSQTKLLSKDKSPSSKILQLKFPFIPFFH